MKSNWYGWLVGWIGLGESLVTILTLGRIRPRWALEALFHFSLKEAQQDANWNWEGENGNRNDSV